jgi:hypothetical protein
MVVVLLAAGALLGSFALRWSGTRLDSPAPAEEFDGLPTSLSSEELTERISVEVLNGAGDAGAAAAVTERLRQMGFDVKTYGNAASFGRETSVVIDRSGRPGAARAVADSLRIGDLTSELEPDLYLDATIILGRDWRQRLEASRDRPSR